MLKAKRAMLTDNEGVVLIKNRQRKNGFEVAMPSYNKNSMFGMAVDSVSRLCEQKKLRMYLTPPNAILRENTPKTNAVRTNSARKEVPVETDSSLADFNTEINATASTMPTASTASTAPTSSTQETMLLTQDVSVSQQAVAKTEIEIEDELEFKEKIKNVDEVIGIAATNISKDIGANCIISIEKKRSQENSEHFEDDKFIDVDVVIFRRLRNNKYKKVTYNTKMRKLLQGSVVPIKELLMEAIKKEYIKKGDKVVCVEDESIGMGYKGLLFIFDVDNIFFNISMHHLTDHINSEVLEAVINIAMEISKDGFEGKPMGTAFVIGDREEILKHSKQMIINPFMGCPEENRKVTDPILKETIKNFAQLDGVFLIDKEGIVLSAGTYLNVDVDKEICDALPGFGTRHRCCAALTKLTNAIAVVVSQSGGKIRIFRNGKIIMKIP